MPIPTGAGITFRYVRGYEVPVGTYCDDLLVIRLEEIVRRKSGASSATSHDPRRTVEHSVAFVAPVADADGTKTETTTKSHRIATVAAQKPSDERQALAAAVLTLLTRRTQGSRTRYWERQNKSLATAPARINVCCAWCPIAGTSRHVDRRLQTQHRRKSKPPVHLGSLILLGAEKAVTTLPRRLGSVRSASLVLLEPVDLVRLMSSDHILHGFSRPVADGFAGHSIRRRGHRILQEPV